MKNKITFLFITFLLVISATYSNDNQGFFFENDVFTVAKRSLKTNTALGLTASSFIYTGESINKRGFYNVPSPILLQNGKVLVIGGQIGVNEPPFFGQNAAVCELYDPATGQWTATSPINTNRHSFTATLLPNGKVLISGGYDVVTDGILKSTELYDPATGNWSYGQDMNHIRVRHSAVLLQNGNVLVMGGNSTTQGGGFLNTVEIYDVANDAWSNVTSMNSVR